MKNTPLDYLEQILGAYFHQDWPEEFGNEASALRAIIKSEPKASILFGIEEIDAILSTEKSEEELGRIMVDSVGCYFEPKSLGMTYGSWLRHVREELAIN